jgi:hypothetical protein
LEGVYDQQRNFLFGTLTLPAAIGVALHLVVAIACYRAFRAMAKRNAFPKERFYWMVIGLVVLLSGVWELSGAEQTIQDSVREFSRARQWYDERRAFQAGLVSTGLIATAGISLFLARRAYRIRPSLAAAVVGCVALLSLLAVRLVSLHIADRFLYDPIGPFRMNWIIELACLAAIAAAALRPPPSGRARGGLRKTSPPAP